MLATGDVGIITLNSAASLASVPSKIYKHMASARPVIAITSRGYELDRMVNYHKCGIVVEPNSDMVVTAIRTLMDNHVMSRKLGQNGYQAVTDYYDSKRCINMIIEVIEEVVK